MKYKKIGKCNIVKAKSRFFSKLLKIRKLYKKRLLENQNIYYSNKKFIMFHLVRLKINSSYDYCIFCYQFELINIDFKEKMWQYCDKSNYIKT